MKKSNKSKPTYQFLVIEGLSCLGAWYAGTSLVGWS